MATAPTQSTRLEHKASRKFWFSAKVLYFDQNGVIIDSIPARWRFWAILVDSVWFWPILHNFWRFCLIFEDFGRFVMILGDLGWFGTILNDFSWLRTICDDFGRFDWLWQNLTGFDGTLNFERIWGVLYVLVCLDQVVCRFDRTWLVCACFVLFGVFISCSMSFSTQMPQWRPPANA